MTTAERKRGLATCRGVYLRRRRGRLPHIELLADNIFGEWPRWAGYVPILRTEILYDVLFNELAHHLLDLETPWHTRSEPRANRLGKILARQSFRRRHPRLLPLARAARKLLQWLQARRRKAPVEVVASPPRQHALND